MAKSDGAAAKCSRVMGERTTKSGSAMSNVERVTRSTQDICSGDGTTRSSRVISYVEGGTSGRDMSDGNEAKRVSQAISGLHLAVTS